MKEEKLQLGRFEPGHPRYGGRQKKSSQQVKDICDEYDFDPIAFMVSLAKDGVTTQVVIKNGKKTRVEVSVPLEMRADLAKYISRFRYPTLSATQVTGANEGPVGLATFDLNVLLADPKAAEVLLQAAMLMAEQGAASIEAESVPKPKLLEADFPD